MSLHPVEVDELCIAKELREVQVLDPVEEFLGRVGMQLLNVEEPLIIWKFGLLGTFASLLLLHTL